MLLQNCVCLVDCVFRYFDYILFSVFKFMTVTELELMLAHRGYLNFSTVHGLIALA